MVAVFHPKRRGFCPECGPAQVSHALTKFNYALYAIAQFSLKPFQPLIRFVRRNFSRQINTLIYFIITTFYCMGMVRLAHSPSVDKDTDRTKCMWKAAVERGVKIRKVWMFGRPLNIFLAAFPNGKRVIFEGLPRPEGESASLEWVDNKSMVRKIFREAGFPVPRGEICFTLHSAKKIFSEIRKKGRSVVVKPTVGSRSRHTRTGIKTEEELAEAFTVVKQISPIVLVEEELQGAVYRVVLIGGKISGILRREPPQVIGNGNMTVRELTAAANRERRSQGLVLHEILINEKFHDALRLQQVTHNSVPELGKKVIVGTKIGRGQGGVNTDVAADEIHLENRKLFLDIGQFLQDPLVGIDFIIEDIRKPWRAQVPCGVIELNSLPFLDSHMYPFEGTARDLSGILWDEVLRKSV